MTAKRPVGRLVVPDSRAGWFQNAAVGFPCSVGPALFEDWLRVGNTLGYGELGWTRALIGSGSSVLAATSATESELGVISIRTSSQAGKGAKLHGGNNASIYSFPIGTVWSTKIKPSGLTGLEMWSGFQNSYTTRVRTSDNTQFIGLRYDAAISSEWQGVVKDGAAASNETTVDLGTAAVDWIHAGFEVVDTGDGVPGFQWFTLSSDYRYASLGRTTVGEPQTTNIPVTFGTVALAAVASATGTKYAYQDFWQLGGRTVRNE